MDVAAGGQVHDGVGTPAGGPHHLVDLLGDRAGDGRIANVGIDFHPEHLADDHRLTLGVVVVGRDHRPAERHLDAHQLGRHTLARGDERHLRGDLTGPRPLQLRTAIAHHTRPWRQARMQIDHRMRIRVRARGVIQIQVLAIGEVHPPKRHARTWHPVEIPVVLAAAHDRASGHRRIDNKLSHHKLPIGARSPSAQVCRLRFGGHHDHGGPVDIQRVRELVREFFAAVHIHRPASEPCCKGGDVKSR